MYPFTSSIAGTTLIGSDDKDNGDPMEVKLRVPSKGLHWKGAAELIAF